MKKITIIGLGTLGGAICKNLAEMESIDELILVDYDIVESKNIHNSVYNASYIGEMKVDALKDILKDNVNVVPLNIKYIEGKTLLPKSDLVVDCRDIVCDRGKEIDVRLYISGKVLIIDCRKNIRTQNKYEGSYRRHLSKSELNKAGFFAAQILCSKEIDQLITNKTIQKINLNLLPSIINKAMKESISNRIDIIYESANSSNRLHGLEDNIQPIMNLNKSKDIEVYIGEKEKTSLALEPYKPVTKIPEIEKTKFSIIPRNSLRNSNDLIKTLSSIVKQQHNIVNFIITLRNEEGETFVELLEETGAA